MKCEQCGKSIRKCWSCKEPFEKDGWVMCIENEDTGANIHICDTDGSEGKVV